MKDSFINKFSKHLTPQQPGLNDILSEKINQLVEVRDNAELVEEPSNLATLTIDHLIDKTDDLNLLDASLALARSFNPDLGSRADEAKYLIKGLANLIAQKLPNISLDEQLEKLSSLWELKKDSYNEDIKSEIHRLQIAYTNALYVHKNSEPGGSIRMILELEASIADLQSQLL